VYKVVRITKRNLKEKEERVNELLKSISLRVSFRYDYATIDVYSKFGDFIDTLTVVFTNKQAYDILDSIEKVLKLEQELLGEEQEEDL